MPPMPLYMLAVDIQKLVTSMLANTDTPIMAQIPVGKEKEPVEEITMFLRWFMLK